MSRLPKEKDKYQREYDAFGPWIWPIAEEEEIPDLYLPHFRLNDTVEMAFKVPRNIERRNAQPRMDLYDSLVALDADSILILERDIEGKGVHSRRVGYEEVVAVGKLVDLLYGELLLHLADGTVTVTFNTVSEELIDDAVALLLDKQRGNRTTSRRLRVESAASKWQEDELSTLYRNLVNQERGRGPVEVLAYQATVSVEKREKGPLDRLLDLVVPARLQECIFLAGEREVIVYHRIPRLLRSGSGHYGYVRTCLPWARLSGVEREEHNTYEELHTVSLTSDGRTLEYSVTSTFPKLVVTDG